jgi:hypothetical protein
LTTKWYSWSANQPNLRDACYAIMGDINMFEIFVANRVAMNRKNWRWPPVVNFIDVPLSHAWSFNCRIHGKDNDLLEFCPCIAISLLNAKPVDGKGGAFLDNMNLVVRTFQVKMLSDPRLASQITVSLSIRTADGTWNYCCCIAPRGHKCTRDQQEQEGVAHTI